MENTKLLTVSDMAEKTGFKKSYFYNRKSNNASTLKFLFTRPLLTTKDHFDEWLKSLGSE